MSLGKLVFTKIRFIGFVCILVSFQAVNHRLVLCQEKKNRALVTFPPLQIAWDEHTLKQELRRARITASLLAGKTLHFSDLDGLAPRLRVIRQRLEQHLISRQFRKNTPTIAQLERQLNQIEARFKRRIQNQDTVPKRGFEERVAAYAEQFKCQASDVTDSLADEWRREQFQNQLAERRRSEAYWVHWLEHESKAVVSLATIPRVPTSEEIDEVVENEQNTLKTLYEEKRNRFVKPRRIVVRRILKLDAKEQSNEHSIESLRQKALRGESPDQLVALAGAPQDIRRGGRFTLSATRAPELLNIPVGGITEIKRVDGGAYFFIVETQIPAFVRHYDDATVQRELAAELLRQTDRLPNARRQAIALIEQLKISRSSATKTVSKIRGGRFVEEALVHALTSDFVEGVGKAPDLVRTIHTLEVDEVSETPIPVRQDYVIVKLTDWQIPSLHDWWTLAPQGYFDFESRLQRDLLAQWRSTQITPDNLKTENELIAKLMLSEKTP